MLKIFSIFNSKNNKKAMGNIEGLRESISYLMNQKDGGNHLIDKFHTLMYLQKIICNSITYNDYGYKTIYEPLSAPKLDLKHFLPRNGNYHCFNLDDDPIYLSSTDTAFITMPWNNQRIIDNIRSIGNDAINPFDVTVSNIDNVYIYPLGIVLVASSGNHSQFVGLLKDELSKIKVNRICDISEELIKDNGNQFTNFYGAFEGNDLIEKWQSLMKIGKYLLKYNKFPPLLLKHIKNKDTKGNGKEVVSMSYKDKVTTEFSNTAYQKLTGDVNLNHIPSKLNELWYDGDCEYSVISLSNKNADDSKWKVLYEMLKHEFNKLK